MIKNSDIELQEECEIESRYKIFKGRVVVRSEYKVNKDIYEVANYDIDKRAQDIVKKNIMRYIYREIAEWYRIAEPIMLTASMERKMDKFRQLEELLKEAF